MSQGQALWITLPLLGGLIGFATNWLAVKMIFRPIEPRRILGMHVQGMMGRRQPELARSVGRVVSGHLLSHDDLAKSLGQLDFEALVGRGLARGLAPKLAELRRLPLVGGFLTDERVADLQASLIKSVLADRERLVEELSEALEGGMDIEGLVAEKVAAFPMERLEQLVLEVGGRELRAIVILGGVLGLLIGVVQAGILTWMA